MSKRPARSPPSSPIKPPERCPYCYSPNIRAKGRRLKKLETVRLYICRACERRFTPGPRGVRNKTYPLSEILEALTAYNQGHSLEDAARRLSSRHGHAINPATISRWLSAHPGLTTYRRLRARGRKLFAPAQLIRVIKLYHARRSMNSAITAPRFPFCATVRLMTAARAIQSLPRSPIFWRVSPVPGLRLFDIKCAWFNETCYNEFFPRLLLPRPVNGRSRYKSKLRS